MLVAWESCRCGGGGSSAMIVVSHRRSKRVVVQGRLGSRAPLIVADEVSKVNRDR